MKANVIAKAIIAISEPEMGDIISNLKLQKLMYYVQGFHIAMYDKPLFEEKVIAWQYGPVVKEVYDEYKQYGSNAIVKDENFDIETLSKETQELLKDVYNVYGQYSATRLMNMTHQEAPWIKTEMNHEISHQLLKEYFVTQIEA